MSHHMKALLHAGLHREKRGKGVHFSVNTRAMRNLTEQLADPHGALARA